MPICYINPDGSHVRGCDQHRGDHPWDWCRDRLEERRQRIAELERELAGHPVEHAIAAYEATRCERCHELECVCP